MDDPLGVAAMNEWAGKEVFPPPGRQIGWLHGEIPDPVDISEFRRSAYSVGDYNPLWTDSAYAKTARYGVAVAPPYFFYAIDPGSASPPLPMPPNVTVVYAGTDWEFHEPLRAGDVVHVKRRFLRAEHKESKFSNNAAYMYGETTYLNQNDEVLAVGVGIAARFPVDEAKDKGKYLGDAKFPTYTEEMLRKIQADKRAQEIRGANPRYFEDVNIGDKITPVVQGPMWMAEVVNYFIGGRRWGPTDFPMAYPRHPDDVLLHPLPDPWTAGHINNLPGQAYENRAMPRGFDVGYQRVAWLLRCASAWISDAADLKSLKGRLLRPNFEGDVSWYTGEVVDKRVENGEHLVECSLTGYNQDDVVHTGGSFIAALPTKR
jgi:acyl dehydratase